MKIKRYSARDMRSALRAVQQEQGPDAVILSSHETADGIELVAAVDYDESLINQAQSPVPDRNSASPPEDNLSGEFESSFARHGKAPVMHSLEQRMDDLQQMLQERLDQVDNRCHSDCPGQQAAHRTLVRLGLEGAHAARLSQTLERGLSPQMARRQALRAMVDALPVAMRDPLHQGGALALMGPTGVGKTTTAAKLAARHILRFGQGSVQFVGTDEYRIGAQEQLAAFGRILDAPLHRIQSASELSDILRARQRQELILVDTAGVGGRDLDLHQQFDCINGQRGLHRAVCLPASTAPRDLSMQMRRFAAIKPSCLILTKLDETRQLGSALGFVMQQTLPLAYTTDGQQVPEDLHRADPLQLVTRVRDQAVQSMEKQRACA